MIPRDMCNQSAKRANGNLSVDTCLPPAAVEELGFTVGDLVVYEMTNTSKPVCTVMYINRLEKKVQLEFAFGKVWTETTIKW